MNKSYLFRIYPTITQEQKIIQTFGCCRFVYNHFLQKTKEIWETKKLNYTYYEWYKDLKPLKQENEWLYLVDSHALVNALQNLNSAYQRFFREIKKKEKATYPKFKSKKQHYDSYRTSCCGTNIRVDGNKIRVPILGWVYCRNSYGLNNSFGKIINATIKLSKSGKYYLSIYCENVDDVIYEKTGMAVGIDVGIKNIAVLSNGKKYEPFHTGEKYEKKLAVLERRFSRKEIGSKNWEKQRKRIAKHFEKRINQRNDYYHKLSTEIVKSYDVICLESISLSNLSNNTNIAKFLSDRSLWEFKRQLMYKCKMHGKEVLYVDRFYPSSQLCSNCGNKNAELKNTSIREWVCPICGDHHDRDINAAKNILAEAMSHTK